MENEGLSVIVCSIYPDRLKNLQGNIASTIGEAVDFEIIYKDNRTNPEPLAKVYNSLACKAQYKYLLFIHEDAGFESVGWYREIASKLKSPEVGLIGFAGGKLMGNAPSGWNQSEQYNVLNLTECGRIVKTNLDEGKAFSEVVTVDGFAMFVRREVWQKYPFDEVLLDGFHGYDTDFGLSVGSEFINYVSNNVRVFHNSTGNLDARWVETVVEMHKRKWSHILPRVISSLNVSDNELRSEKERAYYRLIKIMRDQGVKYPEIEHYFRTLPMSRRHIGHLLKLYIKYR
ncbi:MAG: glycosyltransferase family protein [Muribaculaceae bacterium]|nr:glycosyltransferase family protein [Muribaculaceae bacterium]